MRRQGGRRLIGRTIVDVDIRPVWDAERGRYTTDPVLYLDNGARVTFNVEETGSGSDYGIRLHYWRPHKKDKKAQP